MIAHANLWGICNLEQDLPLFDHVCLMGTMGTGPSAIYLLKTVKDCLRTRFVHLQSALTSKLSNPFLTVSGYQENSLNEHVEVAKRLGKRSDAQHFLRPEHSEVVDKLEVGGGGM